jgi:hypothetical protein
MLYIFLAPRGMSSTVTGSHILRRPFSIRLIAIQATESSSMVPQMMCFEGHIETHCLLSPIKKWALVSRF